MIAPTGATVVHVFDEPATESLAASKAVAVVGLPKSAVALLSRTPQVVSITPEVVLRYYSQQVLPSTDEQWGLDQIDQQWWPRDYRFNYFFPGTGVHVYIVDSGIRGDHAELKGRLGNGYASSAALSPYEDRTGHGTGVAAVAAGATYGVAKSATVHSVRISRDSLIAPSDAAAGLDWVRLNRGTSPAVVNYSASGDAPVIRDAIQRLIDAGVPVVKAVPQSQTPGDACIDDISDTVQWIIAVGASDPQNARWPYSDYGGCVDIFAPGVSILTAGSRLSTDKQFGTGTSFAAPFVTGVVAGLLQQLAVKEPGGQWASRSFNILTLSATGGVLSGLNGSANKLVSSLHQFFDFNGVNYVSTETAKSITWSLRTFGGNGSWSNYRWEVSVKGGPYELVGTGASYTRTFAAYDNYDMRLRTTATSFNATYMNTLLVQVVAPPQPPLCNPGNPTCCSPSQPATVASPTTTCKQ